MAGSIVDLWLCNRCASQYLDALVDLHTVTFCVEDGEPRGSSVDG